MKLGQSTVPKKKCAHVPYCDISGIIINKSIQLSWKQLCGKHPLRCWNTTCHSHSQHSAF